MTGRELIDLLEKGKRRSHLIGDPENGIIAALGLEGRLFAVVNGTVLSRVFNSAILNHSNKALYLNPGGDALWPAPEGSCFGYEYGTGRWRVPPAITGAVWEVISSSENRTVIGAEIDLVNNLQVGIPCEFERHIEITRSENSLTQNVTELIRYIGTKTLRSGEFLLAPWSLCQFDSGDYGKVIMPPPVENDVWDFYGPSVSQRRVSDGIYVIDTGTKERFQLGLSRNVPWIEYISGDRFRVRRYSSGLPSGQDYIDIADIPPEEYPSNRGVKLSVYCDPSGFMEIEACGGTVDVLLPGTELTVKITTEYTVMLH